MVLAEFVVFYVCMLLWLFCYFVIYVVLTCLLAIMYLSIVSVLCYFSVVLAEPEVAVVEVRELLGDLQDVAVQACRQH